MTQAGSLCRQNTNTNQLIISDWHLFVLGICEIIVKLVDLVP